MSNKRTAKDEADYNANLRREAPITSEVIVELRNEYRALLEDRERLLEALIGAQDALRFYRLQALATTKRAIKLASESRCVAGCDKHYWDDVDGWHHHSENE